MANKSKKEEQEDSKKSLDDFVSLTDEVRETSKDLQRLKHPVAKVSEKSDKALREYAFSIAQKYFPDFKGESADKLTGEELEKYLTMGQKHANQSAAKLLRDKADEILDGISKKGLESILGDEESFKLVLSSAQEKDREKIGKYFEYKGLEQAIESYDKRGTTGSDKMDERVQSLAVRGAQKEQMERLKAQGFSKELQELGAQLVAISYSAGHYSAEKIKEHAKTGLAEEMKKSKGEIDEEVAYKAIRSSIKNLIKSDNPEVYTKAMGLVYSCASADKEEEKEE
jgi:hypothetical protein